MRIGILETGTLPDALGAAHGDYTSMFRALLAPEAPEASYLTVPVWDGALPDDVAAVDGWVVTGSRHGVYDPLPWMAPLEATIRACRDAQIPLFGVCFGHQIMAQALGGAAELAAQGWGVGRAQYDYADKPGWTGGAKGGFSQLAMHRDQVTRQPEGTTLLARSAHCPIAALAYGDPQQPWALSVQPHPEFRHEFLADLVETRRSSLLGDDVADAALKSLSSPTEGADWAAWCIGLFTRWRG
ncbi:MAG: gamma-glutamyl-gamma-aminobutyrate hydrolase family protein [Pseudomonadota bacterium]